VPRAVSGVVQMCLWRGAEAVQRRCRGGAEAVQRRCRGGAEAVRGFTCHECAANRRAVCRYRVRTGAAAGHAAFGLAGSLHPRRAARREVARLVG